MSTPNPLAPQGSLLEQQAKGRSTFQVISFIGAVHVVLLCGILWTACGNDKPKPETANTIGSDPYSIPATPVDNNSTGAGASNQVAAAGSTSQLPPGSPPSLTPPSGNVPGLGVTTPAPTPGGAVSPPPAYVPPSLPPPSTAAGTPPNVVAPNDPTPLATAAGEYKVVKGDLGTSIAKKNGVSLKALVAANPTVNWNRMKLGQVLQIPAGNASPGKGVTPGPTASDPGAPPSTEGVAYVVRPGDTGTKIAAKHGVKWAAIRRANNLKTDALHPGQKLIIPGATAGASGATPTSEPTANPVATPIQVPPTTQPSAIPLPPRTPSR